MEIHTNRSANDPDLPEMKNWVTQTGKESQSVKRLAGNSEYIDWVVVEDSGKHQLWPQDQLQNTGL